jgi:hypothetical protein
MPDGVNYWLTPKNEYFLKEMINTPRIDRHFSFSWAKSRLGPSSKSSWPPLWRPTITFAVVQPTAVWRRLPSRSPTVALCMMRRGLPSGGATIAFTVVVIASVRGRVPLRWPSITFESHCKANFLGYIYMCLALPTSKSRRKNCLFSEWLKSKRIYAEMCRRQAQI